MSRAPHRREAACCSRRAASRAPSPGERSTSTTRSRLPVDHPFRKLDTCCSAASRLLKRGHFRASIATRSRRGRLLKGTPVSECSRAVSRARFLRWNRMTWRRPLPYIKPVASLRRGAPASALPRGNPRSPPARIATLYKCRAARCRVRRRRRRAQYLGMGSRIASSAAMGARESVAPHRPWRKHRSAPVLSRTAYCSHHICPTCRIAESRPGAGQRSGLHRWWRVRISMWSVPRHVLVAIGKNASSTIWARFQHSGCRARHEACRNAITPCCAACARSASGEQSRPPSSGSASSARSSEISAARRGFSRMRRIASSIPMTTSRVHGWDWRRRSAGLRPAPRARSKPPKISFEVEYGVDRGRASESANKAAPLK